MYTYIIIYIMGRIYGGGGGAARGPERGPVSTYVVLLR